MKERLPDQGMDRTFRPMLSLLPAWLQAGRCMAPFDESDCPQRKSMQRGYARIQHADTWSRKLYFSLFLTYLFYSGFISSVLYILDFLFVFHV